MAEQRFVVGSDNEFEVLVRQFKENIKLAMGCFLSDEDLRAVGMQRIVTHMENGVLKAGGVPVYAYGAANMTGLTFGFANVSSISDIKFTGHVMTHGELLSYLLAALPSVYLTLGSRRKVTMHDIESDFRRVIRIASEQSTASETSRRYAQRAKTIQAHALKQIFWSARLAFFWRDVLFLRAAATELQVSKKKMQEFFSLGDFSPVFARQFALCVQTDDAQVLVARGSYVVT